MSNCRTRTKLRKPSKAQKEAYGRLVARDGWKNVTTEDAALLAAHPWLTYSQRQELAAKVAA